MTTRKSQPRTAPSGSFIQTVNGHSFFPQTGKASCIDLDDIAHSLSNLCRYNGHPRKFYSVAEHAVLVSRIVRAIWPDDVQARWAGLHHDDTEAYVGDVTTPLKMLLPKFMRIEDEVSRDIAVELNIRWTARTIARVKLADRIALSTEARLLFANVSHWRTIKDIEPRPDLLCPSFPLEPGMARSLFKIESGRISRELTDER